MRLVECVPNISEGRDNSVIAEVVRRLEAVAGVTLLDVDPGRDTNRTVITFVGAPEVIADGAFAVLKAAGELIDMRRHKGAHPRHGATDVCPFVPVSGVTMDECVALARQLGARAGAELGIPVYFYEFAATSPQRKSLADVRSGEYEALPAKLKSAEWKPDAGPAGWNDRVAQTGVVTIGARKFLVAYNINFNTKDKKKVHDIALELREAGRLQRDGDGNIVRDEGGETVRQPGRFKAIKGLGWYIDDYARAQLSINFTDLDVTPVHAVFDAACEEAAQRGLRVTGSELVGLIPLESLLAAGRYFLTKAGSPAGVPEAELVRVAVQSLGLDELYKFDAAKKVVEYRVAEARPLVAKTVAGFVDELSSDSPAPGGGSVAALCGALSAGLSAMVGQITFGAKGHEAQRAELDKLAIEAQTAKAVLLRAIDDDTAAFNAILSARRLPKASDEEKTARAAAILAAQKGATDVPLGVLRAAAHCMALAQRALELGFAPALSDAGVAAMTALAAAEGAYYNVRINLADIGDEKYATAAGDAARELIAGVRAAAETARTTIEQRLKR